MAPAVPTVSLAHAGEATESRINRRDAMVAAAFLGDLLAIALGLLAAFWIRFQSGWIPLEDTLLTTGVRGRVPDLGRYAMHLGLGLVLLLAMLTYIGFYDFRHLLRYRRAAVLIIKVTTAWCFVYLGAAQVLKLSPDISRGYAIVALATCGLGLLLWRRLFFLVARTKSMADRLRQRILFIGWNREADRIAQAIFQDNRHPYQIVGCVPSAQGRYALEPRPDLRRLGDYNDIHGIIAEGTVDLVVAADLDPSTGEMISLANLCEHHYVQFKIIPNYFQMLVSSLRLETVSGIPILGISELRLDRFFSRAAKRVLDIAVALPVVVFVLPVAWLVVAGTQRLQSPGPVFYRQPRSGLLNRRFQILKFRTMHVNNDDVARQASHGDTRIYPTGKLFRKLSLDELPQFVNVLFGDMSVVGPRPHLVQHDEQFARVLRNYHIRSYVKPGITGLAQVRGHRGETRHEQDIALRVESDIEYIEKWSLGLDVSIILRTGWQVFFPPRTAY